MTINQLTLNTPSSNIIAISFEMKQFITYTTSDSEIEHKLEDIKNTLETHLLFFRNQIIRQHNEEALREQRIQAEEIRKAQIEQEELAKKRKVFSTFSNSASTLKPKTHSTFNKNSSIINNSVPKTQTEKDILLTQPLSETINSLIALGFIHTGHLPGVYRFANTPYAYTIKDGAWASPFGDTGRDSYSFLESVAQRLLKYDIENSTRFFKSIVQHGFSRAA